MQILSATLEAFETHAPDCLHERERIRLRKLRRLAEAALAITPAAAHEIEVQETLSLCKGDAMMALRITLIANAFLEAQIDELKSQISKGFTRGRRKPRASSDAGTNTR